MYEQLPAHSKVKRAKRASTSGSTINLSDYQTILLPDVARTRVVAKKRIIVMLFYFALKMPAHSLDVRQRVVALFEQGLSRRQIAGQLSISYGSVCAFIKSYKAEGHKGLATKYVNCGRRTHFDQCIYDRAIEMKSNNDQLGAPYILIQLAKEFPDTPLPKARQLQNVFKKYRLQPAKTKRPRDDSGWAKKPLARVQVDAKERLKTADGQDCCYLNYVDEATGSELDAFVFPLRPHQ